MSGTWRLYYLNYFKRPHDKTNYIKYVYVTLDPIAQRFQ